jgi:hypothetical protein
MVKPTPVLHCGQSSLTAKMVRFNNDMKPLLTGLVNLGPFSSGISASLPISIAVIPRDHAENGSHGESDARPESSLTSASYRKASYAARDRSRSLDPGALDFEAVGDDESLDGDDGDTGSLSRGRHRALKILQARSELPAEGMWRSLAS